MKIFDFFRKYMGKMVGAGAEIFDKLETEPKFLTSWSRSRTKMDRLRNTGGDTVIILVNAGILKGKVSRDWGKL
jgi:hypothetical protein